MVPTKQQLEDECKEARREILKMVSRAGTSHIGSNLSAVELGIALNHLLAEGDEIVWSPGWKAALIYYTLYKRGIISFNALEQFPESPYLGLAETKVPGVLCNAGSVGHGLSIGVGIAYAMKKLGKPGRVWCVLSDGELNEGSVWEALMFADHHELDNITVVVDRNGLQAMGDTTSICNIYNLTDRLLAFGAKPLIVRDGNDAQVVYESLQCVSAVGPTVIVCDTIKGRGVSFMENRVEWHYKNVVPDDLDLALAELR